MRKLFTFAALWMMVGFVSGTATLMGPVRWITDFGRERGWAESAESIAVRAVILCFVLLSAVIAAWFTRIVLRNRTRHIRFGLPALVLLAAVANLWLWLTPGVMGSQSAETEAGSAFTFGPYPTAQRLTELSNEGYTGVISLLHPAVVPFETKLIRDGRKAVEAAGLEFLHVPMLPWISENSEAMARIEEIVARDEGRYYVHCYLGRDRIRVIKHLVARLNPQARIRTTRELEQHEQEQSLTEGTVWARGEVVLAASDVYLTPQPVDNEYVDYIVPGLHGSVVSLLSPDHEPDRRWIEEERQILESHGIEFTLLPLPIDSYDPQAALRIARKVRSMQRPLIVHAMLGVHSDRSPAAEAFLQAFLSDLPPLPPSLFLESMDAGEVSVVGPNVALGPRPAPADFGAYLQQRGVREFVHIADSMSEAAAADRVACLSEGLNWRLAAAEDDLLRQLSTGGPWYLYGPGLEDLRPRLERELGPAIPEAEIREPDLEPLPASVAVAAEEPDSRPFLIRLMPGAKQIIVLGPVLALLAALIALLVAWLRTDADIETPYTRKIFHFMIFTLAGVMHVAGGLSTVALFGGVVSAVVLYAVYRGEGFGFYEALARPSDAPHRTLFVLVPLATTAAGGLAANLLFGSVAYVGYLVAGWGDAIAEPVGRAWGRHKYRVPSLAGVPAQRSLEGSAAVLIVGTLAAFLGLWLNGIAPGTAFGVALACGLAGASVEAVSNHGLDNFTVQLAAAATAFLLL